MGLLDLKFKKQYSVAVFCGSRHGIDPAYTKEAKAMGRLLAAGGMRLVYGAGGAGLMGEVARSAIENGGKVYGVTERIVKTFERPIKTIVNRTAPNMPQRKLEMMAHSDAFVHLPGGWGTYDEFFEVAIVKQITDRHRRYSDSGVKFHESRPIVLISVNGFYDPLMKLIEHGIKHGFMIKDDLKLVKVVKTAAEAMKYLNSVREENKKRKKK